MASTYIKRIIPGSSAIPALQPKIVLTSTSSPPTSPLSYAEFASIMDASFKRPKPRKTIHYNDEKKFLLEVSLSIAGFIGSLAIERVIDFINAIKASENEETASQAGIVQLFGKDGTVRQMARKLARECNGWSDQMYNVCLDSRNPGFDSRYSDAIDYADEVLTPLYDFASQTVLKRLSTKTLSTPLDPVMLASLSTAIFSVDLAETYYLKITSKCNFPEIKQVRGYDFFRMTDVWNQIVKMITYMDFLDTNHKPLKYNIRGMLESKQMQEIYTDMFHIFFSSEFVDKVCLFHSGIDYELRHSDLKSLIASYEPYTQPLSYYKQKYSNN